MASPADFEAARPAALLRSVTAWGSAQSIAVVRSTEARRLARGVGILGTSFAEGRFPGADRLTGNVQPAAAGELVAALERGESWSSALGRVRAADPSATANLTQLFDVPNMVSSTLGNKPDLSGLGGWSGNHLLSFWNPANWAPPSHGSWWVAFQFSHPWAHVIAAAQALEAQARAALKGAAEPAEVRDLRNLAASFGHPITIEAARATFARGRGLSEAEAVTLSKPGATSMASTITYVPRNALLSSMIALRRIEPVRTVNTARISEIQRMYRPGSTTTMQTRQGDATGMTAGGEPAPMMGDYTDAAIGGGIGLLVGGIAGRLLLGSWTGAAIGAGVGAVAGGGVGYAVSG